LRDGFNTFVHATDLARAFALAVELARPGVDVYNFSAADIISVVPLRKRLEKNHPDVPPLPPGWPDLKSPIVIDKAKALLGWEPRWSFQEYFRERQARGAK
jgi:nucleoside-diphosphate-sugar epimerase